MWIINKKWIYTTYVYTTRVYAVVTFRLKHRKIRIRKTISTCDHCRHSATFGYSVPKPLIVSAETETYCSASHRITETETEIRSTAIPRYSSLTRHSSIRKTNRQTNTRRKNSLVADLLHDLGFPLTAFRYLKSVSWPTKFRGWLDIAGLCVDNPKVR